MAEDQQTTTDRRRERVQRLKKGILLGLMAGMLIPWILCGVLCAVIFSMGRDRDKERQEYHYRIEGLEQRLEKQSDLLEQLEALITQKTETFAKQLEQILSDRGQQEAKEESRDLGEPSPETNAHKVYLTFDDGPSSNTGAILDILKEYDVKATFFVLGKETEEDRALLKRIVEEGHSLGMHSYSHRYEEIYSSKESFAADLQKLRTYLTEVTGVTSSIYRFPGGSSNTVTDTDIHEFIDYLEEQGVVYYDWNVASGDAAKEVLSPQTICRNSIAGIEDRSSSVILLHDAAGRGTTVEALPMIIEAIQAMEDTFLLPITEETPPIQHVKARED